MLTSLIYIICYCLADKNVRAQDDQEIIFHYNNTYKFNQIYEVTVNKYTEYVMDFSGDPENIDIPARVTVASELANKTYPLFITARQQKGVFSWQLPMIVETPTGLDQFNSMSRTLCPHNNLYDEGIDTCDISSKNSTIIHLTSSSPDDIIVKITLESVNDFYVKINQTTKLTSTPSQPRYYFYPFKQDSLVGAKDEKVGAKDKKVGAKVEKVKGNLLDGVNLAGSTTLDLVKQSAIRKNVCEGRQELERESINDSDWFWRPKSVILMIESNDDVCAVISIQKFSCPVFDNERDILYDGHYFTMTRRGGITITQDKFPVGFFIVFIVKSSDEDCEATTEQTNTSSVSYLDWNNGVINGHNERNKSFSFTIVETISYEEYFVGASVVLVFFVLFYVAFLIAILVQLRCKRNHDYSHEALIVSQCDISTTNLDRMEASSSTISGQCRQRRIETQTSDTDSEISVEQPSESTKLPARLCVAELCKKRPKVISIRSQMYLWNILTVSVFYTLPVVQLVITYQRLLNQSGNQDLCYFNFFCSHPLFFLSDFNHVYSNIGYVLLGLLFLAQVWRRHRMHRAKSDQEKQLGIPQHFGLLYAMGVSLVSEGILSAAYHVCPNSMNFQFDTSFMYITGVLSMVKVYQSRHPDINARAHATLAVLALIIFIGLVGVLNANLYFWIGFTMLHLITCLILSFQIYYLGRFKLDNGLLRRVGRELWSHPVAAITPTYVARCVLLLLANIANWAIAAYGVTQHSRDFASHLLLVLMSNLFLYTLFYIAMKLLNRETINWYSWVFIAITYTIWFSSSYFFFDSSTNWALTPAESRRGNRICTFLDMYDSHDIWHFMSSVAMFFSFNMYLTIDDNLEKVDRSEIMVF